MTVIDTGKGRCHKHVWGVPIIRGVVKGFTWEGEAQKIPAAEGKIPTEINCYCTKIHLTGAATNP